MVKIAWETVMLDKTNRILDILERIIKLFKPKFHNKITKIIIFFGFTLCVESQFNLIETFLVALYETNFGKSDYLRTVFESRANPWVGLTLIVFGLVYSAVTTLGLDLISKIKAAMPKIPSFELYMYNSNDNQIGLEYTFRGKLCSTEMKEIPDNNLYSKKYQNEMNAKKEYPSIHHVMLPMWEQPTINKDFYRERANLLKTWGGAEIFSLGIKNTGDILAKNVRVRISFKKESGNRAVIRNEFIPKFPHWESVRQQLPNLAGLSRKIPELYDIKEIKSESSYIFEWIIDNLQAKSDKYSNSKLFIRIDSHTSLDVCIYCDELSEPISKKYSLQPTIDHLNFDLKTLTLDDKAFFKELDGIIMDGFLSRLLLKRKNKNHDSNDLIP